MENKNKQKIYDKWTELISDFTILDIEKFCNEKLIITYDVIYKIFSFSDEKNLKIINDNCEGEEIIIYKFIPFDELTDDEKFKYTSIPAGANRFFYEKQILENIKDLNILWFFEKH